VRRDSSKSGDPLVDRAMDLLTARVPIAAALLLASCTSSLGEKARPCPCAEGWVCCPGRNLCAPDVVACGELPDHVPPGAPVLQGFSPSSPTNQSQVEVAGTAEPRALVELFAVGSCSGEPAASGTADGAGQFRVPMPIAANATSFISARAVDAAGNASRCAVNVLEVVQDSIPPATPILSNLWPGPISFSVTRPELSGTGDPGSRIVLYEGKECERELPFGGVIGPSGNFRVAAEVDRNTVTIFSARAFDAIGNGSACSAESFEFEQDSIQPAAPAFAAGAVIASSNPAPMLSGSAEPGVTVKLFGAADCAGDALAERVAGVNGSFAITVAVAFNAASTFSARAIDRAGLPSVCSSSLTYIHDTIPPDPVESAFFLPGPVGRILKPVFAGVLAHSAPGDRVFLNGGPGGGLLAIAPVDADGFFSASITVQENSVIGISATAVDAAGNRSASRSYGYRNDTIAPVAPGVVTTSVPSPTVGETAFMVLGTGEWRSRIDFWSDSACTRLVFTPSVVWQAATSFTDIFWKAFVVVAPNSSTDMYATSTDDAGNRSECSKDHVSFAHSSSGPGWGLARGAPTSADTILAPDGTAFALRHVSQNRDPVEVSLHRAAAGDSWSAPEPVVTVPWTEFGRSSLASEAAGAVLAMWSRMSDTAGELHFRVRSASGSWSGDQIVASYLPPRQWIRGFQVSSDRAGGAWAAWLVADLHSIGSTDDLWIAHHTPAGGWGTPTRILQGLFASVQLAGGASGHAFLATGELTALNGTTFRRIAFYDPASGWSAPEVLDGGATIHGGIDDRGRVLVATAGRDLAVLTTRRHLPDTGWEDPVVRTSVAPAFLDQIALKVNARGDAALSWSESVPFPPFALFVQRFTDADGWAAPEAQGTFFRPVSPVSVSLGNDGSIWILGSGFTPRLSTQPNGVSDPAWLRRFDPASGWARPQLAVDDTGLDSPLILRNDAGTALMLWSGTTLEGPFGTPPPLPFAAMRWFH
jgi:hypothetical protein